MPTPSRLLHVNWSPTARVLRQFGWLSTGLALFLAWRWWSSPGIATTCLISAGCLTLLAEVRPTWLQPVYRGLVALTLPIGMLVGELAMLLIYLLLLFPLALLFRVLGRDPLQLAIDRQAASYWEPRPSSRAASDYFHQF